MNRREFGLSAAALTAAPMVSALPILAEPLSPTAARIYPWAEQYVRVHGQASAAQIASVFKIPVTAAQECTAQLFAKGVTTAPSLGVARALDPIKWQSLHGSGAPQASSALGSKLKRAVREADLQTPDELLSKAAKSAESEPTPEDQSSGSEESPRA